MGYKIYMWICKTSNYQPAITCSNLAIETLEQGVEYGQWRRSGVFIVYFEHILHLDLELLLLTSSRQIPAENHLLE